MQWFYSLFIRPEICTLIQNYKDDPSRWEFLSNAWRFTNKKDRLIVEFNSNFSGVYTFIGRQIRDEDDLCFFERRKLITAFKQFAMHAAAPIPTKATYPEEFI